VFSPDVEARIVEPKEDEKQTPPDSVPPVVAPQSSKLAGVSELLTIVAGLGATGGALALHENKAIAVVTFGITILGASVLKMSPILASGINQVGSAIVEVRGKYARMNDGTWRRQFEESKRDHEECLKRAAKQDNAIERQDMVILALRNEMQEMRVHQASETQATRTQHAQEIQDLRDDTEWLRTDRDRYRDELDKVRKQVLVNNDVINPPSGSPPP
jgi:hypothetical protein